MNRRLLLAAGPCCTRCKTPTGKCAKDYACKHHLESLNTVVRRVYEADIRSFGQAEAVQRFSEGAPIRTAASALVEAGVSEPDAHEWALRQMDETRRARPELFELDISATGMMTSAMERWADGDTRR